MYRKMIVEGKGRPILKSNQHFLQREHSCCRRAAIVICFGCHLFSVRLNSRLIAEEQWDLFPCYLSTLLIKSEIPLRLLTKLTLRLRGATFRAPLEAIVRNASVNNIRSKSSSGLCISWELLFIKLSRYPSFVFLQLRLNIYGVILVQVTIEVILFSY